VDAVVLEGSEMEVGKPAMCGELRWSRGDRSYAEQEEGEGSETVEMRKIPGVGLCGVHL
jgi:hypothetical protein